MYAILSSRASSRITRSPTRGVGISRSPSARSRSSMRSTAESTASVATGRLRRARRMLAVSFSRSKSVRLPSFFTRRGILRSTRSYVVKRLSHLRHLRRRRIVFASGFERVSTTWVSSDWQNGQRMALLPVHRKARAQRLHRGADAREVRLVRRPLEHVGNEMPQLLRLGLAHTPRSHRRGADADSRRDRRLLPVVRDGVLVEGDPGAPERVF